MAIRIENDDSTIAGGADRGGRTERRGAEGDRRSGRLGAAAPAATAGTEAKQFEGNEALVGKKHRQIENDSPDAALAAADHHPKGVAMGPAAFKETEIGMAGPAKEFTAVDTIEVQACQRIPHSGAASCKKPTIPSGSADPEGGTVVGGGSDDGTSVKAITESS